jgi:hypothetical protein
MSQPTTIDEAAQHLAITFEDITGMRPKVAIGSLDENGCRLIAVGYPGDELVRAMQIEAFVVEKGERIQHRSQLRNGQTMLAYLMVPRAPQGFHLSTVKPARVVPAGERHKWLIKKLLWNQSTTCDKCGCKKTLRRDYTTVFQMPGGPELTERPACTGNTPAITNPTT